MRTSSKAIFFAVSSAFRRPMALFCLVVAGVDVVNTTTLLMAVVGWGAWSVPLSVRRLCGARGCAALLEGGVEGSTRGGGGGGRGSEGGLGAHRRGGRRRSDAPRLQPTK